MYRENRLSGFAFIVKTVCQVLQLSCILSFPIVHISYPIVRVPYPIVRVSYPIVHVSYRIIYHVKVNVAGTVCGVL